MPERRLGAREVLARRVAGDAPITRSVRPLTTAYTATRACRTADPERGTVPSTTTEIANGVSCCDMLLLCHAATRPARPCGAVRAIGEPPIVSAHSPHSQSLPLRWASMTDNSTNNGGTDAESESGSGLVTLGSPDEEAALPE